jgi:hypothetical protein
MGSLFANGTLEQPIESFTGHLTSKHKADLSLAGTPYQGGICDTESLRYKCQKCTGMSDGIIGVLTWVVSQFVQTK